MLLLKSVRSASGVGSGGVFDCKLRLHVSLIAHAGLVEAGTF